MTWSSVDELLFTSGWFALDAQNMRVAGVRPASLAQGLSLIGQGRVATIVGRLRPGVVAVDVDLVGERGHAVVEAVAGWCHREGLWHVVRPSGGADGRTHVLVGVGARREHLEAEVDRLRAGFGVTARMIDVRQAVRPLTAPHRSGGCPLPLGDARVAQRGLRKMLRTLKGASSGPRRGDGPPSPSPTGVQPLEPTRQRRRRDLPPEWATYLATGKRPTLRESATDTSGSTYEFLATARMVQAGWTARQAWAAIADAHPRAMTKARASWPRWVGRWNQAVAADDDYRGGSDLSPTTAASITAAREGLRSLAWSTSTRARPGLLTVGHVVLDRMERTGKLRVPVPERDLVLDTGIRDRRVIREHLRALGQAIGTLHQCFDPRRRDVSSHEFEIPEVGVVMETPPPRFHTPLPAELPPGLPRMTWPVLRTLPEEAASLEALAQASQLAPSPTAGLSESHRRTLTTILGGLAEAGLASCDEQGRWRRTGSTLTAAARQRATAARREARATVTAERQAYRAPRHSAGWDAARAAAVKAQRARSVGWWTSLPHEERTRRAEALSRQFAALTVQEQLQQKTRWAQRDARAGIEPRARHDAWLAALPPDEVAHRSATRQAAFRALPQPAQIAAVQAWDAYRETWGVPRAVPAPSTAHRSAEPDVVDSRATRDEAFLTAATRPRELQPTLPLVAGE